MTVNLLKFYLQLLDFGRLVHWQMTSPVFWAHAVPFPPQRCSASPKETWSWVQRCRVTWRRKSLVATQVSGSRIPPPSRPRQPFVSFATTKPPHADCQSPCPAFILNSFMVVLSSPLIHGSYLLHCCGESLRLAAASPFRVRTG